MDSKKRGAELQLTAVDATDEKSDNHDTEATDGARRVVRIKLDTDVNSPLGSNSSGGFGFHSYKGIDPFAKTSLASASLDVQRKPLSALSIPSPKSPKLNPFSKPSPVHNPFMTIVESKDELWNTVARSASSGESSKSETPASVDLPPPPPYLLSAATTSNAPVASVVDDSCHRVYGKIYAMTNGGSVVTGEEEEECTMQVRAKLFKLDLKKGLQKDAETTASDAAPDWSEVGVGPVKLLKPCVGLSPGAHRLSRLVMRRESKVGGTGTKLLLNVLLKKYVTLSKAGDKMFRLSCMHQDEDALGALTQQIVHTVFLFRTKLVQEADQLFDAIQAAIDASPSAASPTSSMNPSSAEEPQVVQPEPAE